MSLFGSSGIRRVVDREFLQLAFEIGLAAGSSYTSFIVGCDTRTSGDAMRYAFLSGLFSAGAGASYASILPTPTLAYAGRHFEAGAMITASHNPPEYNGIKLVNPDGSAFDSAQREQIEQAVYARSSKTAHWEDIKSCTEYSEAIDEHLERILEDFTSEYKLKIAVDCGCGAASNVTPSLLTRLGCDVIPLNCQPGGYFPREIEPVPDNLGELIQCVKNEHADLGIAHDGDGDRIAIVDDKGRFVPQDKLMALLAQHAGAKTVVTTVDASMLIDELGFEVIRTRVGDAYVSDELRRSSREDPENMFGGESSGCFIFPQVSLCPDAIYAAAQIVRIAGEGKISSLVDRIPAFPLRRGAVAADRDVMEEVEKRLTREAESGASLETTDGLRLAFKDGWLLIRPSGTEPKIRITAEATDEKRVDELYNMGLKTIEECLNRRERAAI